MTMVPAQLYSHFVAGILTLLHRRIKHHYIVDLDGLRIQICPHVFHPLIGRTTKFFIQHMRIQPSSRVLEIGTGSGAIAAAAIKSGGEVIATDINPYAVKCAKATMKLNGFQKATPVLLGDLFTPVQGKRFDVILFNPPYFPVQASSWIATGWSAGPQSELLVRFFHDARSVLAQEGQIQILFSSAAPLSKIFQMIRKEDYTLRVLAQGRLLGFLERLYLLSVH